MEQLLLLVVMLAVVSFLAGFICGTPTVTFHPPASLQAHDGLTAEQRVRLHLVRDLLARHPDHPGHPKRVDSLAALVMSGAKPE